MFTGLIGGLGSIRGIENLGRETRFRIAPLYALKDFVKGESIAVNGACLTVEAFGGDYFQVYASAETMRLTNLGELRIGDKVNLERALALGDRLGGHLVSGHVDCLAVVGEIRPAGQSRIYRLNFPAEQAAYVVAKGSVALDGISLTVNGCGEDFLEVNIIPETREVTTISGWKPGRKVNMETDLIGKYVRRMMSPWLGAGDAPGEKGGISEEFLRRHGF